MQELRSNVESVAPNVTRLALETPTLAPATDTNSYFVTHGNDVLLVEPATPYEHEQQKLRDVILSLYSQGKRIVGAVLTHHHGDHIGAATWLSETFQIPIWAHAITARRLEGRVHVARTLDETDTLLDGSVELLHTPGHAPGHLCLRSSEHRWMIVGDMVASIGTILIDPSDGGDMRVYLEQLQRLATHDPSVLLPAHGAPIEQAQELLSYYRTHRLKREAKVLLAVTEGQQTIDQIVAHAYSDTPSALWPIAKRSALAHLHKLQYEERVFAEGANWLTKTPSR